MNEPYVEYHDNGYILCIKYYQNGMLHRKDGPAIIVYFKNGQVKEEEYYQNGCFHRTDGPAHILYYENGQLEEFVYFINRKEISQKDTDINLNDWPLSKQNQVKLKLQVG